MTSVLTERFADYESYHQTGGNKVCHLIGIPMIMVSLLGLLSRIQLGPLNAGLALWGLSTLWYLRLDWKMAIPFSAVSLVSYFGGKMIPDGALWALFVLGWVFQGIGHGVYERKSPAFFKNLEHILIGPLWVFAFLVRAGNPR